MQYTIICQSTKITVLLGKDQRLTKENLLNFKNVKP